MKKLMIAASAALCATVGFSDVTSANIVGYSNTGVRDGAKMVGCSFNEIGLTDGGMDIFNIAPTGYENVDVFKTDDRGIVADFEIRVIGFDGAAEKDVNGVEYDFYYYRSYIESEGGWQDDGIWVQNNEIPIEEPGMYVFNKGDGMYFVVQTAAYEGGVPANQYSLNNAGEAILNSQQIPIRNGFKGVVNPISASVDVFDIKPVGYKDVPYFMTDDRGIVALFELRVIGYDGGTERDGEEVEKDFYYYHSYIESEGGWQDDAIWVQNNEIPVEERGKFVLNLGDAVMAIVQTEAYEGGVAADKYSLEFPGIED